MTKKPATKGKKDAQRELTPRARLFVAEYQKDLNATQAAIRAGYSPKTAAQQASRLLTNVKVAAAIEASVKQREEKALSDTEYLKQRLRDEADADILDLYDDAGNLKPVKDWPVVWRRGLVMSVETKSVPDDDDDPDVEMEPQGHGGALKRQKKRTNLVLTIKFADRTRRLELLGRHVDVQAWKDKKEHSADEPLKELFQQIAGAGIRPKEA